MEGDLVDLVETEIEVGEGELLVDEGSRGNLLEGIRLQTQFHESLQGTEGGPVAESRVREAIAC